jgi:hypothetical protein
MELLDDVCNMESLLCLFRNSVSFGERYVHGLRLMHDSLRNHFEAPVGTSVKRLKWKLGLICLEIVLIFMQDRCTVCIERTICLEINLGTPGRTP